MYPLSCLFAFASLIVVAAFPGPQGPANTTSPVSNVPGKAFNRIVIIWLENTDYAKAAGDPNLAWLAKQGITLENYFALTHPSEPNYVSSVSGDYYGMNNDNFNEVPTNISTIVDLLEEKGISWGEYQQDMPYTGFQGFQQLNAVQANDYVRKHNPLVIYQSVATVQQRLSVLKNFTYFQKDLQEEKLPQWMFITPNMTNDGHDTSVTTAGIWSRNFLTPLLKNEYFMKDTLILLTFDENETYTTQNRVFSILLGGAIDPRLHGTTDSNYYDHYSELATVQANWDLHTLGRYDVGANVFSYVAEKTGDKVRKLSDLSSTYLNQSYSGIFNSDPDSWAPAPVPNTELVWNGRTVSPLVKATWQAEQSKTYYDGSLEVPSFSNPPKYPYTF